MRKRIVWTSLALLFALALTRQAARLADCPGSLLVIGSFAKEDSERFATMLKADPLVTAYASYDRSDWVVLEDEAMRRYSEATRVSVFGAYAPPYPVRMVSGQFTLPLSEKTIVISAAQASALFCTYDCIGKGVLVEGERYEVVGVYEPDGLIANLSRMGKPEAFIASAQPLNHWVVTVAEGKETQREFAFSESLSRMGTRNITITPLFRTRKMLCFALYLQAGALLCLLIARLWKRLRIPLSQKWPHLARCVSLSLQLLALLLFIAMLSRFPINPAYLPIAFTAEALSQKAGELLMLWNNRTPIPSMEGSYLNWLAYSICVISAASWLILSFGFLKRRN